MRLRACSSACALRRSSLRAASSAFLAATSAWQAAQTHKVRAERRQGRPSAVPKPCFPSGPGYAHAAPQGPATAARGTCCTICRQSGRWPAACAARQAHQHHAWPWPHPPPRPPLPQPPPSPPPCPPPCPLPSPPRPPAIMFVFVLGSKPADLRAGSATCHARPAGLAKASRQPACHLPWCAAASTLACRHNRAPVYTLTAAGLVTLGSTSRPTWPSEGGASPVSLACFSRSLTAFMAVTPASNSSCAREREGAGSTSARRKQVQQNMLAGAEVHPARARASEVSRANRETGHKSKLAQLRASPGPSPLRPPATLCGVHAPGTC